MTSVQAVDFKRPVGRRYYNYNFSSGPFWTYKIKTKAKYKVFPTYFTC